MRTLGSLVTVSTLTSVIVSLFIGSCISTEQPTPRAPDIPVVKLQAAQGSEQLGPVQVSGLYCWEEVGSSGKRGLHGIFDGYNPTDRPIRIRASGESALIKPGKRLENDSIYRRGLEGRCVYQLSILRSDPENAHLASEYKLELAGRVLTAPSDAAEEIVTRFLYDIDRRDIDSIKSYTDPPVSASNLASYVGWRAGNEPMTVETARCDPPQFQDDKEYLLVPTSWHCYVDVIYAVLGRAESGRWAMEVIANLQSGRVSLMPGRL